MKTAARFVYGGGGVKCFESGRPITRWLVFAAAISVVPALSAFVLVADSSSLLQGVLTFPWCLLAAPTPILIISAVISFFLERPRTIITEQPNPHHDPHNLY